MDTLKANVAAAVRSRVLAMNGTVLLPGELAAETRIVTDLQTSIKVPGPYGPRYFIVQVREQY